MCPKLSPANQASCSLGFALLVMAIFAAKPGFADDRLPGAAPRVTMKDMSWLEIKGFINCGSASVIIPTGGIEQNGPQMVLGKHDYIVSFAAEKIAREIGNTLVAPVLSFVPEGDFSPPSGNMKFPGTIGLQEPVFELVLDNIARSLKLAGFRNILFIGDHGQSQPAQAKIAAKLTAEWRKEGVKVSHIASYYEDKPQYLLLEKQGETLATIGVHAGLIDTSELLAVHAEGVKVDQVPAKTQEVAKQGASGLPQRASGELGRRLLNIRIEAAVEEIRKLHGG